MRSVEAEKIAKLVQHPRVQSGKWRSPYDLWEWSPIERMPEKFQPTLRIIHRILNSCYDWTPEAFLIDQNTSELSSINIALRTQGVDTPLKVPLFGRPVLDLRQLVPSVYLQCIEQNPLHFPDKRFVNIELATIIYLQPSVDNQDTLGSGVVPAYDHLVLKPFWFFAGVGRKERAVGEDPFRCVVNFIGAPIGFVRQQLKLEGSDDSQIQGLLCEDLD
ncbi:hypothetical protein M1563_00060 [Patescibacteria group bacterium]|nr:hypothetical protein [Patescibacteria group bacterium]MCL5409670.1 hypothetical protein [Patescibacteria group bacterium]